MNSPYNRYCATIALDDTSFPKKGTASVGVVPQYCGVLGKVANCQSVVTLEAVAAGRIHFPIAAQLYLPKTWTEAPERLEKAGVPKPYHTFQKKWRIALHLLETTPLPFAVECVVFDAGYGEICPFLVELDQRDYTFMGQIPESHSYWSIDVEINDRQQQTGRPRQYPEIADKTQKADSALTLPSVRRVILNALSLLACPRCQCHLSHLSWNTT